MTARVTNRIAELKRPSPQFPRNYVPAELVIDSWEHIRPLFEELLNRELQSPQDLEKWLHDISEVQAVISEEAARRYIAMTCATDDKDAEKAYIDYIENIQPKTKPYADKINHKLAESPYAKEIDADRYGILLRSCQNSIDLFRDENVALETELNKLSQNYNKITGAQTVEFNGKEYTLQQMSLFLEEQSRPLRQQAWEAMTGRRLQDAEALDELLDQMLVLRQRVAKNAGFNNFRDYQFRVYERFDYSPEDCFKFHDTVECYVVPVMRKAMQARKEALQLDILRPWDTACDPYGRTALHPFVDTDQLVTGCQNIFNKVDAELGGHFAEMIRYGLLDLESRKGKAPGGYQEDLSESRLPFIFTNAVGLNRDVFTLLHEGGHAFHQFLVQAEPLLAYRHAPIEFCEVASMGMELLSMPYLDEFYSPTEVARTVRDELENKLALLPWVASIDAFQHWLYTNPGHTREERCDFWVELTERFGSGVDHTGYEQAQRYRWQAQLHIFEVPFYYIEYGIAQLGALQVWSNYRKHPAATIEAYKAALKLGGTKALPELFDAATIRFDFTKETLQPLMAEVQEELEHQAQLERG